MIGVLFYFLGLALALHGLMWVWRSGASNLDKVLIGGPLLLAAPIFLLFFPVGLVAKGGGIALFLFVLASVGLGLLLSNYRPDGLFRAIRHYGKVLVFAALGTIIVLGGIAVRDIRSALAPDILPLTVLLFSAAFLSPVALFRLWRMNRRYTPPAHPEQESATAGLSERLANSQPPPAESSAPDPVRGAGWEPGGKSMHADRIRWSGRLVGEVRGFRERTETNPGIGAGSKTIWTFRLERFQEGTRLPPVAVEIRGKSMSGSISDGDTVSLGGWYVGRGVVTRKRVYNVTTGASVGVATSAMIMDFVGYLVLAGIVFAILLFIASR